MKRYLVLFSSVFLSATIAAAQDTRTVNEPVIPPSCTVLDAHLSVSAHSLAAADEQKLDTARIQQALDTCATGHGVMLRAKGAANAFLSGPLELRAGVTLVVDKGVTLFGSRDPRLFDITPNGCGVVSDAQSRGCKPLIKADNVAGAGVMGDGVINGRGGEKLIGQNVSWWGLAAEAHGTGNGKQRYRLIVADTADNFTLYRITLRNSPDFHVSYDHGNGFTVWGIKIDTLGTDAIPARNTDGIDPGEDSKNITITQSYIRDGDDNVAIKGGAGGATNITVSHDHFYWGHGMSIGSQTFGGISAVRVSDLSLDGTTNGIRIKSEDSRGGLVQNVVYDDVCIRNSAHPITLSTDYGAAKRTKGDKSDKGDKIDKGDKSDNKKKKHKSDTPPSMQNITLHNVRVSGGGEILFDGYSEDYRIGVNLDNVLLASDANYSYTIQHTDIHMGPGPVNLLLTGRVDSTVTGTPGKGSAASCADKFVPFPKDKD